MNAGFATPDSAKKLRASSLRSRSYGGHVSPQSFIRNTIDDCSDRTALGHKYKFLLHGCVSLSL
ncbi:MAG: hypothetical protein PHR77_06885 [Kiritimatiellae bacterium]|nr:hypothetical protein [Kiritimatiellia bacterium]